MPLRAQYILDKIMGFRGPVRNGAGAVFVDAEPIVAVPTPPPVASAYPPRRARRIAGRARVATCGGVAWLRSGHLLTLNLRGNVVHSWKYTPGAPPNRLLSDVREVPLERFQGPENFAVSPDGSLLAVTYRRGGILNIYNVDPETGSITPAPALEIHARSKDNLHGVAFSPCGRWLAYTTIGTQGAVHICHIKRDQSAGYLAAAESHVLPSPSRHLRPKGVSFSPDGCFIAVGYGPSAGLKDRVPKRPGAVHVYRFDGTSAAVDPKPVGAFPRQIRFVCAEDVAFLADGTGIVATDQGSDRVVIASFDAASAATGSRWQVLEAGKAKLSFPHGCTVSADGLYVAVACYGTDCANLYRLARRPAKLQSVDNVESG